VRFKSILSAVLCVCTLLLTATAAPKSLPVIVTAEAKSVSQYQSELDAAKSKANKLKSQLNELKKQNAPYEAQKAALDDAISATQAEINLYEDQIVACERTIAERSKELTEKKEKFNKRLVAMYTSESSSLSVLLSSEDYGDYLAKAELVDTVTRKDYELITSIVQAVEDLDEANAALQTAKAEIDAKKAELMKQYEEVNAIVAKYQSQISGINSNISALEKEQKEIQAAINKANQEAASGQGDSNKNTIVGTGNFAWPVPGYYTISSQFGRRWGRNHNGIDIASSNGTVYGAKIVAADSGTVILSKYYSGYGYCVIVNHGNGFTTLYAHMKAQSALRVGDSVTKGSTIIGYVGATGNVTGPHLHFEITYNGSYVNPMNYYN